MNTIKLYLTTSGRVADMHKDFPLFQGQFQNKLLNVYVPTSILAPQYSAQYYIGNAEGETMPTDEDLTLFVKTHTATGREPINGDVIEFTYLGETPSTFWLYVYNNNEWTSQQVDSLGTTNSIDGTSVQIGMVANKRNGVIYESKKYFMRYLKTLTYQNVEYAMYERKLPKEFTKFVGQGESSPIMIFNVVDMDLQENVITKVITSQYCHLDVMPSTDLDQDPDIEEPTELERISAEVDTLNAQMQTKQDKVDSSIDINAIVSTHNVVGAINDLSSAVSTNTTDIGTLGVAITDLSVSKQDKTDNNLATSDKTVVGAINELNTQVGINTTNIGTNADDISALDTRVAHVEDIIGSGEDYIGTMSGTLDPTDIEDFAELSADLTAFVLTKRPSVEGGDVVIYTQQIAHGTDKSYKFIYSGAEDEWTFYEIPPVEKAGNDTYGIIKGSYDAEDTTTKTQVNIVNGEIKDITMIDSLGNHQDIADYVNTQASRITSVKADVDTNTRNIATNTQNISSNTSAIGTLDTTVGNIIDGTTAVGYAKQAEKDSLNRNIAQTYMTQNLGATKQELYDYALPRTFNDVSFVGADHEFVDTVPDSEVALYSATSTLVGDTQLFYIEKTIDDAYFELANKNSYSDTLYVSASADCTVSFRVITQVYHNATWTTVNTELTEPVTFESGVIRRVEFGSTMNSLNQVLDVIPEDKIKQTFEVQTSVSTPITFSVWSNSTYPSAFYLNTTSQVIVVSQGALGEMPVYILTGTSVNGDIVFTIPSEREFNSNVNSLYQLTYSGVVQDTTRVKLSKSGVSIRLETPYNYGSLDDAKVADLTQVSVVDTEQLHTWLFTAVTKESGGEQYLVVSEDNLTQLGNIVESIQADVLGLASSIMVKPLALTSTTMTDEQITQLRNYNCVLTNDLTLGTTSLKAGAILTVPFEYSNSLRGIAIYNNKVMTYYINLNNKQMSDGAKDIVISQVANIQTDKVDFSNGATITKDSSDRINLNYSNSAKVKVGSAETIIANRIGADSDNTQDIGRSAVRWKDLYLAGNLTDGTASIAVADIANKSEIPDVSNMVTTDTAQTITGVKTFKGVPVAKQITLVNNVDSPTGNQFTINNDNGYNGKIKFGAHGIMLTGGGSQVGPDQDNASSLGGASYRWLNAYISNNLSDGTNSITIAEIASKDFVNSSIATNTANFIGTFANVTELESYSGTVTNNDYAFVTNQVLSTDYATFNDLDAVDKTTLTNFDYGWVENGTKFDLYRFDIVEQEWVLRVQNTDKSAVTLNTAYNRYKATVSGSTTTWEYEYTLNNSSFTAQQWEAINSGITALQVSQIATNTSDIGTLQTAVSGKQDALTAGSNIDITGSTISATDVVTTNTSQNITAEKTLVDTDISFKNSSASGSASWQLEEDIYGQLAISRTYNGTKSRMAQFNGNSLLPEGNNGNLGSSSKKWQDLYLSGNLTDGTDSVAVGDIATESHVADNYISYTEAQTLTDEQKAQVRANIGAGSASATTVLVNGVAQSSVSFDSDPQTQIDGKVENVSFDSSTNKLQKTIDGTTTDVVTFGSNAFSSTTIPTDYVSNVVYDTTNKKLTKTVGGTTTSDIVSTATLKTDMGLSTVATTGAYGDLSGTPTLGTASSKDTGTTSGTIPVLGTDGKLPSSVIPASAITDTYVANSQNAMLALSNAEVGDVCVRTDINKSFILQAEPYSTLSNWQELLTPTDAVTSVNSQTGAVVLTASDVGALPSNTTYVSSVNGSSGAITNIATTSDLANKMDTTNPTGTGSLSLNRASGSTVGTNSVAIGTNTTASGHSCYAEGYGTTASGGGWYASHAEGYGTTSNGYGSHAEGFSTTASRQGSHAEGYQTTANELGSHAEGGKTTASGYYSHAEGQYTTAQRQSQHVFGEYNVLDTTGTTTTRGDYVEIVGNGTAINARSNARTLDWSGNEYLAGSQTAVGGYKIGSSNSTIASVSGTALTLGNSSLSVNIAGSGTRPTYNSNSLALYNDIPTNVETTTNKVTSLSSNSTDTQYPSAKCVYDLVGDVETLLTALNSGSGV